jgi:hypothetical protein
MVLKLSQFVHRQKASNVIGWPTMAEAQTRLISKEFVMGG